MLATNMLFSLFLLASVGSAVFTTSTCGRNLLPWGGFECTGDCESFPVPEDIDSDFAEQMVRGMNANERVRFQRFVQGAALADHRANRRQYQWNRLQNNIGWRMRRGYLRLLESGRIFQYYDCVSDWLCGCVPSGRYFYMDNARIDARWRSKIAQGVLKVGGLALGGLGGGGGGAAGGVSAAMMPSSIPWNGGAVGGIGVAPTVNLITDFGKPIAHDPNPFDLPANHPMLQRGGWGRRRVALEELADQIAAVEEAEPEAGEISPTKED